MLPQFFFWQRVPLRNVSMRTPIACSERQRRSEAQPTPLFWQRDLIGTMELLPRPLLKVRRASILRDKPPTEHQDHSVWHGAMGAYYLRRKRSRTRITTWTLGSGLMWTRLP